MAAEDSSHVESAGAIGTPHGEHHDRPPGHVPAEEADPRIRDRAYLISQGADAGPAEENWYRAERELAEEDASALADEIAQRAKEAAFRAAMTHP